MRGQDTSQDSVTGAVVRRNVIGLLEAQGKTPAELYNEIGWTADRFWGQFSGRIKGPRLDFVELAAGVLEVPSWRLLTRAGEPGTIQADGPESVRQFIRRNGWSFVDTVGIPTESRAGELEINLRIRQNVAIGCWQNKITEVQLYTDRLRITRAAWYAWYRRKTGIALVDLWRIAEALEMQPWELLAEVLTEAPTQ